MKAREMLFRVVLLGLSAVFGLLVAEVAVRLVRPQTVWRMTPGLFTADEPGFYRLAAGYRGRSSNRTEFDHAIEVNGHGLRGPRLGAKRLGTPRILVIGDSFPFGVGVEDTETFVARLPAVLDQPSEALNGGIPGVGVPHEVRWLERHGLLLAPDVVVLAIFLGNDLSDATDAWGHWEIRDGQLVAPGSSTGVRHWLYFHSHLFVLLKNAVPAGLQRGIRARLGMGEPVRVREARQALALYARNPADTLTEGIQNTGTALDRLLEATQPRGVQVAAVLIPELAQVVPARWEQVLQQLAVDPVAYDRQAPNRIFAALLAERGIATLDLTPSLSAAEARGEQLYFRNDRHWTPAGHAHAAEALAAFLAREGLLRSALPPSDGLGDAPAQ